MDEFDKIRELSEDLSNRKEPVFTGFLKNEDKKDTPFPLSENQPATPFQADISLPLEPLNTALYPQKDVSLEPVQQQPLSSEIKEEPLSVTPNDKINFIPMDEVEEKAFPSLKMHLILISVLLCVLILSMFGFYMYKMDFDDTDEVATITASADVVKEAPVQSGGMTIPDQDKLVYNRIRTDNVTTKVESLFPEPEKPVIPQILAIEQNAPEQPFVSADTVKGVNPFEEQVVSTEIEQPIVPQPQKVVVQEIEKPVLPPVEVTPAPIQSAQPKKEVITLAPVSKTAVVKNKSEAKPVSKDIWRVQLFASNNKEAVEKVWSRIEKKHNTLLSNMSYLIKKVEIPTKGTYYRLQVGQFPSREMADGLCAKLRALKQDCIPTK